LSKKGILFHAKHAYMPNVLGYCGPEERGRILRGIETQAAGDDLVTTLKEFEAAYPFLKLIARNSGKEAFEYAVPEAYWIGNSLLERVPASDFHGFAQRELKGMGNERTRSVLKGLRGPAIPHHSFYVMSTYAVAGRGNGPDLTNEASKKVAELIDNCRISWGKVVQVGPEDLKVELKPLAIDDGRLALAKPVLRRVKYNPDVKPFGAVGPGDVVSIHWNYACDVLTPKQTKNIEKYTDADIRLVNGLPRAGHSRK
jgi:hypothetical protein